MDEWETKICQNCKREIPVGNYTIHSVHCTRNVQLCPVCKEPVLIAELERHNETLHSQLPCRQCSENVSESDMEDHIRDSCDFTIRSCRFCELELRRKDLLDHESYCGTRTEQCQDCREWIMLKYRTLHLESNHGFLRLDDDIAPYKPPKATNFALNRPPGLFSTRNNNERLTVGLMRRINLLEEEAMRRLHAQVPGACNDPKKDDYFGSSFALKRPMHSRPETLECAFSQDLHNQLRNNINEVQLNNASGVHENKNTTGSRGAVKKRLAPKPPSGDALVPTSPIAAKSPAQDAKFFPEQDVAGPSTSTASSALAGASTSQPKSNESSNKNLNGLVKVKKIHNRVKDDQQRKNTLSEKDENGTGSTNKMNVPKMENFNSFKPMTTEEFKNRVKEIQRGKVCKESEEADSVKESRFNVIKHSLKELRRELKEATAPLTNSVNTNNNIPESEGENATGELETEVLLGTEDEGATGGWNDEQEGENVRLPCEFCNELLPLDELVQHQMECQLGLSRSSPPQRRSTEWDIPCQFCGLLLPICLITEHQERCGRNSNVLFPD